MMEPAQTSGGWVWVERSWHDVRYGFRLLVASPVFTTVAVVSLAIGIGANCAIFSFADALLLRPLPVARPGDVFTVGSDSPVEAFGISSLLSSYRDYLDIRDRSRSLDGLVAFRFVTTGFTTDPDAAPRLRTGSLASSNLFAVMGVEQPSAARRQPKEIKSGRATQSSCLAGRCGSRNSGPTGDPRPQRADQRPAVHRDWRRAAGIHRFAPLGALRLLFR